MNGRIHNSYMTLIIIKPINQILKNITIKQHELSGNNNATYPFILKELTSKGCWSYRAHDRIELVEFKMPISVVNTEWLELSPIWA